MHKVRVLEHHASWLWWQCEKRNDRKKKRHNNNNEMQILAMTIYVDLNGDADADEDAYAPV